MMFVGQWLKLFLAVICFQIGQSASITTTTATTLSSITRHDESQILTQKRNPIHAGSFSTNESQKDAPPLLIPRISFRGGAELKKTADDVKHSSSAVMNGMKSFIASGLAAACSKTLLAPFDTIKTMQQQVRASAVTGERSLGLVEAAKMVMLRPKGFIELYAGLGVSALGAMPSVGLYFGVYSYNKDKLGPFLQNHFGHHDHEDGKIYLSDGMIRTLTVATAAAIGNTVASFSRVPYEVVKQKLQTGQYTSTMYAISHMFQKEGVRAFFPMGGISIQMIRDIPYAIFTLLSYEYLREHWATKSRNDDLDQSTTKPWRDMVAGGIAGGLGSYLTNPMDVIKTRLQTDSQVYNGAVWQCVRVTYAEGGAEAFLRGSVPRLIHKVPANGAFFVFYEFFRRLLRIEEKIENKK